LSAAGSTGATDTSAQSQIASDTTGQIGNCNRTTSVASAANIGARGRATSTTCTTGTGYSCHITRNKPGNGNTLQSATDAALTARTCRACGATGTTGAGC